MRPRFNFYHFKSCPKNRNIRSFLTFKKGKHVHNFEGNRSVRSSERYKMRIVSISKILNFNRIKYPPLSLFSR